MSGENLHDLMQEYQDKFHDSVNLIGLSPESLAKAPALLRQAIEDEEPFRTDARWYRALGYTDAEMPGEDELT